MSRPRRAPSALWFALCPWLLAPSGVAQEPQEEPPAREDAVADSFDALSAEYREALLAWGKDWLARWEQDQSASFDDPPSARFWARFQALADGGDTHAVLWMLQNLDGGVAEDARQAAARDLFARVRRAGTAAWVDRAVPFVVRSRDLLEREPLRDLLRALAVDEMPSDTLRREARLGLAELEEGEAAFALRLDAFRDPGEPRLDPAQATLEQAEELAERVTDQIRDDQEGYFESSYLDLGSIYMPIPGVLPEAGDRYRPLLEGLAERGSARAALWSLENTWPQGEAEIAKLRAYLQRVVDSDLTDAQIQRLAWRMSGFVQNLGVESVEAAARKLSARVEGDVRAQLLGSLGDGLCSAGKDSRERGLALLREVVERYPDSDAASDAKGKLFRHENLVVGKVVPDFEAVDVDGNAFRLSDYKGKVTVLDFWGFW